MKISVIGCGYLGLTHAAAMASLGHEVVGVEVDATKLSALQAGQVPYFEPGLPELMEANRARLSFTDDYREVATAQVHFLGVGTPQDQQSNKADLSYVWAALKSLHEVITPDSGEVVIVGKSTVPPGTAQTAAKLMADLGNVEVVWNPEFLREGHGIDDTLHPDRMVYGTESGVATPGTQVLDEVYAPILQAGTPRIITNYPTAEMIKMAANSFLAMKISFANAWAQLCEQTGGDIGVLTKVVGMDARIGPAFLGAGSGFGGGCLPKDLHSTMSLFQGWGLPVAGSLFEAVDSINENARDAVVRLIARLLEVPVVTMQLPVLEPELIKTSTPATGTGKLRRRGGTVGTEPKRVAILGAAFKANSDDLRLSPALAIATGLADLGIEVVVTDPVALPGVPKVEPRAILSPSVTSAVTGADLVVVGTEWSEYRQLDPTTLPTPGIVVDARNCLNPQEWKSAGWKYYGVGQR